MIARKLLRLFAAIVVCMICAGGARAADPVIEQARELLAKSDAKAAFELLSPLEAQRAGDPEFDYLLGVAALDAGHATRAIFALERVLMVNPHHAQARADIARAYFTIGETDAAKREFESVKTQQIPPEVAATIDRFLDAIERLPDSGRRRIAGYVEVTIGHDTNVNSGPGIGQVAVPVFGGAIATLDPSASRASDDFGAVTGGVTVRQPLAQGLDLIAGLNLNKRINGSEDTFDTGFWDGNLGLAWTRGADVFTAALQANDFYLDNDRYRAATGFMGQWQRDLNARNQVSAYGQFARLRYSDQPGIQNSLRDANRSVAGIAYAHAFSERGPVAYAGAYAGTEDEREKSRPDLGHRLYGGRLGAQYNANDRTYAFANAGVERREYHGPDPIFLVTRDDTQYNLVLGLTYSPARDWKITPQVSLLHNKSNIQIFEYRREIYSVTLRRDL